MNVAAYLRCSSDSQDVESQRAEVMRLLSGRGWDVPAERWYVDQAVSGGTTDREQFKALEAALFRGEVNCVVMYSLDRFSRELINGLFALDAWLKSGARLVFCADMIDLRPEDFASQLVIKLIVALRLGMAEEERRKIRARCRAGIEAQLEKQRRVQAMRAAGREPDEIAAQTGLKVSIVKRMIASPPNSPWWQRKRMAGRNRKAGTDIDRIRSLQASGMPDATICKVLGICRATLVRRLDEERRRVRADADCR